MRFFWGYGPIGYISQCRAAMGSAFAPVCSGVGGAGGPPPPPPHPTTHCPAASRIPSSMHFYLIYPIHLSSFRLVSSPIARAANRRTANIVAWLKFPDTNYRAAEIPAA